MMLNYGEITTRDQTIDDTAEKKLKNENNQFYKFLSMTFSKSSAIFFHFQIFYFLIKTSLQFIDA